MSFEGEAVEEEQLPPFWGLLFGRTLLGEEEGEEEDKPGLLVDFDGEEEEGDDDEPWRSMSRVRMVWETIPGDATIRRGVVGLGS